MKKIIWGLLVVLLGLNVQVEGGAGRIFVDAKGRSIEAELIRYDERKNQVTMKRSGVRKEMTVPITIFSTKDQEYIREWGKMQVLQNSSFKVDIRRKSKLDSSRSRATTASTQVYTDHTFNLVFENGTTATLENIDLEYVIFYEQEHHVNHGNDVVEKQGTYYKKEKITLPHRAETEFVTDVVTLYTWNTYNLKPVDADIHGIRLRLTMESPTKEKISRDFCYPSKLEIPWTTKTENALRR